MTAEQKIHYYLKAAARIEAGLNVHGCDALYYAQNCDINYYDILENFPEFYLFRPEEENTFSWFGYDKEHRIVALLWSAEMCRE